MFIALIILLLIVDVVLSIKMPKKYGGRTIFWFLGLVVVELILIGLVDKM